MKLKNVLAAATLCLSAASAQASIVFIPTDGDVNFYNLNLSGYTLAMFDNDDMNNMVSADHINIPLPSSLVNITANGSDYTASNTNGSITLTNSAEFVLGVFDGTNWLTDNGATTLGGNIYTVSFGDGANVLTVDVQVSTVPVPAAVWLFGTGLIGLAGIARRRS